MPLVLTSDPIERDAVVGAFRTWLATRADDHRSLEDSWNRWVRDGAGYAMLVSDIPCGRCRGRKFDMGAYARTGQPICGSCNGRGKVRPGRIRLRDHPHAIADPVATKRSDEQHRKRFGGNRT